MLNISASAQIIADPCRAAGASGSGLSLWKVKEAECKKTSIIQLELLVLKRQPSYYFLYTSKIAIIYIKFTELWL